MAQQVAIVWNPSKTSREELEDALGDAVERTGAALEVLWLTTSPDDPGRAAAEKAVASGAELVVAAGGDGTVRVVIAGLVGSGIPCALLPAGTVNLLARNLDLPLRLDEAIETALADDQRDIDLIKITADDGEPDYFAVMAGIGMDAVIMDETDPGLKKAVGPAAYAIAAGKALGRKPLPMTITLDDGTPIRRRSILCVIGNVGEVPGVVSLIPEARLDDGRLDLLVASPRRLRDWITAIVRVLLRRHHEDANLDHWTGHRVKITVDGPESYQLDGDTEGKAASLTAEIVPAAVTVKASKPA